MSLIMKNNGDATWNNAKILIGGETGTGKTTLCAQDEKPLFLCHEEGLAQLPVDCVKITSYKILEELIEELKALVHEKKFPYTSIIQDGLDDYLPQVDNMVMEWAKTKYSKEVMDGIQSIGDIPNGTGWARQREYALYYIKQLSMFPCAYIINSHTKQKTVGKGSSAYLKTDLNAPSERLGNAIKGYMDHVIIIRQTERGNKKVRYITTSDRMDCAGKSRGSDGLNPKPLITDGLVLTDDPKENFIKIRGFFK